MKRYLIAWSGRAVIDGSCVVQFERFTHADDANELKRVVRSRRSEAESAEFRLAIVEDGVECECVVVNAIDVDRWDASVSLLPKPYLATSWDNERTQTAARWRLYSILSATLNEAARLRLAKRCSIRSARSAMRRLLIDQSD